MSPIPRSLSFSLDSSPQPLRILSQRSASLSSSSPRLPLDVYARSFHAARLYTRTRHTRVRSARECLLARLLTLRLARLATRQQHHQYFPLLIVLVQYVQGCCRLCNSRGEGRVQVGAVVATVGRARPGNDYRGNG